MKNDLFPENARVAPPMPCAARIMHPQAGRTDEFRGGERWRGDNGGGPREDGIPDVPHGDARPEPARRR